MFPFCTSHLQVRPHYAARQNATHCSFTTRLKLLGICRQCDRVRKRIFCRPSSGYQTVERDRRTWSDFFLKLADTVLKPLTHHMPHGFFWWDRQFADWIFRPRSIERHAAAKPTQRPHILVAWCNFCHAALPLCATRNSVDVPFRIRDSVLSSFCAAYNNADWYVRLGDLPTFCNVSCPVYLRTKLTYRLVSPEVIGWSHTFHILSIPSVSFFTSNSLFWIKSARG